MSDEIPEGFYELWDDAAAWKASGEPMPFELAARAYRMLSDPADRIETRAMLHLARFYGDEIAAGILDALADDEWWSATPPRCAPLIERED